MLALFPEIATTAQSKDIEKLSVLVRSYFAGESATKPKLNALNTIREFGIPVGMAPIKYFGAIAVKDDSGDIRASIIIRDNLKHEQQSFVLCHLLGHFLLQIQPRLAKSEWDNSGFKEIVDPMRRYGFGEGLDGLSARDFATEDLADRFAGSLLMPAAMLHRAMEKLQDVGKVALVFGVSIELVERRLEDLGDSLASSKSQRSGARVATPIDVLNQLADSEAHGKDVPPEQLIRDVSQPVTSVPRAVAAHSYSDAAQSGAQNAQVNASSNQSRIKKEAEPTGLKGMERIRELARRMDKFGDKAD